MHPEQESSQAVVLALPGQVPSLLRHQSPVGPGATAAKWALHLPVDPNTVAAQVDRHKSRCGVAEVVLGGAAAGQPVEPSPRLPPGTGAELIGVTPARLGFE